MEQDQPGLKTVKWVQKSLESAQSADMAWLELANRLKDRDYGKACHFLSDVRVSTRLVRVRHFCVGSRQPLLMDDFTRHTFRRWPRVSR